MKKILLIICLMLLTVNAEASWYIFNQNNRCVGITEYEPNREDLNTRNEFTVYSLEEIKVKDAEYFDGAVRVRVKSQAEINEEEARLKEKEEMALIYHEMFRQAYIAYKSKNKNKEFKTLHNHVDDIEDLDTKVKNKDNIYQ